MPYSIYNLNSSYSTHDPITSPSSYSVLTSTTPFTCRGLWGLFGNPLPAYHDQDRLCTFGEETSTLFQQPLDYANHDFDLVACAFHHFKIEEQWKLAVIAIALQRTHNIEHVDSIQGVDGHRKYQVVFNQLGPRHVLADYVDFTIERRESDILFGPIWEYWAHYDPATKTSTARHLRDFPPDIEMLEAKLKAAIYHSWRPEMREWVSYDHEETYQGGRMQFPAMPFY